MEVLRDYGFPVKGECGGCCCCATCHVYVDPAWLDKLVPKTEEEEDMLDEAIEPQDHSRLSCQIILSPALEGLKGVPGTE